MRAFRLLKQSELEALQARADKVLEAWAQRWLDTSADGLRCRVAAGDGRTLSARDLALAVSQEGALRGVVVIDGAVASRVVAQAFAARPAPMDATHPLLRALLERFLGEWLRLLVSDQRAEDLGLAIIDSLPVECRERGTARVDLLVGQDVAAQGYLPTTTLQQLGLLRSAQTRPAGGLSRRAVAVMPATAQLTVHVADASLTIAELRAMAVGDVIVLDQKLARPLQVRLGTLPAGHAYPGRRAEKLAIELCSIPKA